MTQLQFERWNEFSRRMAEKAYPEITDARRNKLVHQVEDYFSWRVFQEDWKEINDWDGNDDDYFLGDAVNDFFEEFSHYNPKEDCYGGYFFSQITSCIRAGFDVAVKPSGGVVGFTAGDIRRIWDDNVPDWVKDFWEEPFDEIPDSDYVWL